MKKTIKILSIITLAFSILILAPLSSVKAETEYKSKSCYLYDFNSNTEIFARNENQRLPIASMTKIMLLDLVYQNVNEGKLSIDESVTISKNASSMGGSQVFLEENGVYTVKDLIKSVTVASANDASVALAERMYGSEDECVKKMNQKAEELGLKNTLFANCTGLPKPMQYSSAKDITLIFADLIKNENYFEFSKIWMDKINHSKNFTEISNTNKLIKFYNGCDGGKTGFTNEAGFCLTATAKRGNMRLISAVIGAPDSKTRFKEVSNMLNYGFNSFETKAVLDKDIPLDVNVTVNGGKTKTVEVTPEKDFFVFAKKGDSDVIECNYEFNLINAPIKAGDVVGVAKVYKNGVEVGKVNLISTVNVEKMNYFDYVLEISKKW